MRNSNVVENLKFILPFVPLAGVLGLILHFGLGMNIGPVWPFGLAAIFAPFVTLVWLTDRRRRSRGWY
jgi:hypothetical protein